MKYVKSDDFMIRSYFLSLNGKFATCKRDSKDNNQFDFLLYLYA